MDQCIHSSSSSSSSSSNFSNSTSSLGSESVSDMSTPTKRGTDSQPNSDVVSLRHDLKDEFRNRVHTNVTIEEFVEHVWGLSQADIASIDSSLPECHLSENLLANYASKVDRGCHESEFYAPFSELACDLVARNRASLEAIYAIYLWNKKGKSVLKTDKSTRKPDMLSLWQAVDHDEIWGLVQALFEFKNKCGKPRAPPKASKTRGSASRSGRSGRDKGKARKSPVDRSIASIAEDHEILPADIDTSAQDVGGLDASSSSEGWAPSGSSRATKRKRSTNRTTPSSKRPRVNKSLTLTMETAQLAYYALECMTATSRYYITGILVDRYQVDLWYFDRMGAVRTVGFDFRENPKNLLLVLLALHRCNAVGAGFNPHLHSYGLEDPPQLSLPPTLAKGSRFVFPHKVEGILTDSSSSYVIESVLYSQWTLLGRGTLVCAVNHIADDKTEVPNLVAKLTWATDRREDESKILERLKKGLPETLQEHFPDVQFAVVYHPRDELHLPRFKIPSLQGEMADFELRYLVVLVTSRFKKLWEVGSVENFKIAFLDCVECHYHSYKRGKVLHRDLSQNNLMAKFTDNLVKGVLNDWDHASTVDESGDVIRSHARDRTGTWPFIALDLLDKEPPAHLYRHDLESFFYVLVWAAAHFDLEKGKVAKKTPAPMQQWNESADIAKVAKGFFLCSPAHFKTVSSFVRPEFKEMHSEWITPLWRVFNQGHFEIAEVTFERFMEAIGKTPRNWD